MIPYTAANGTSEYYELWQDIDSCDVPLPSVVTYAEDGCIEARWDPHYRILRFTPVLGWETMDTRYGSRVAHPEYIAARDELFKNLQGADPETPVRVAVFNLVAELKGRLGDSGPLLPPTTVRCAEAQVELAWYISGGSTIQLRLDPETMTRTTRHHQTTRGPFPDLERTLGGWGAGFDRIPTWDRPTVVRGGTLF